PCSRSIGSAGFQAAVPCFRYDTSTDALRLSSPCTNHSKPRLISVGGSTRNSPAVIAPAAGAAVATRCRNHTPIATVNTSVRESVRRAAVFMIVPSGDGHILLASMFQGGPLPGWNAAPTTPAARLAWVAAGLFISNSAGRAGYRIPPGG